MKLLQRLCTIVTLLSAAYIINAQNVTYTPPTHTETWYSTGTFYELFVRSFYDSDGDRHGDFNGVTQQAEYLKSLGITGIWFMPIMSSSDHSHGYATIDYMDTEQQYGTMADFENMVNTLHNLGIRVIIDFVVNHCSHQHPFFVDAKKNPKSPYRDWFVWADNKEGETYWYKTPTGYYYGYFSSHMPDFNYENPKVIEYMKSVMIFCLDKGVDGFRYDAVTHITGDVKRDIEFFRVFRSVIEEAPYKEREPFLICEASTKPYSDYLGDGTDSFHAAFNFTSSFVWRRTVRDEKPIADNGVNLIEDEIRKYCTGWTAVQSGAYYAQLIANHDAGVTGRYRPFREFGCVEGKAKLAGTLYMTLPGIPFVYYGEEIGVDSDPRFKGDRFIRTAMHWTPDENAGFTTGKNAWNGITDNYKQYNVRTQDARPDSLLNRYRSVISVRNEHKALSLGTFTSLPNQNNNNQLIAYLRQYNDENIVVIHNFGSKPLSNIKIDLTGCSIMSDKPAVLLGKSKIAIKNNILSVTKLNKYDSIIIKL
ncbi:MAG: hypothetical protein IKQ61_00910 [Spirochaetales bacterium]|nr:hypothetical protein [Spirochaetales bacterium]